MTSTKLSDCDMIWDPTYISKDLNHVQKLKPLYLHYTIPMTTKLARMMTNLDGLLTIMYLDPLVTWSCKVMRKAKNIISPLPEYLSPPHVAVW